MLPDCVQKSSDDLVGWTTMVANEVPDSEVCVHWSIKQNYNGGSKKAHAALQAFCSQLPSTPQHDKRPVLLVSGGGPKRQYSTVSALSQIRDAPDDAECKRNIEWHVAYNPYIPQVLSDDLS